MIRILYPDNLIKNIRAAFATQPGPFALFARHYLIFHQIVSIPRDQKARPQLFVHGFDPIGLVHCVTASSCPFRMSGSSNTDHRADIPLLADYFLRTSPDRLRRPIPKLTETSANILLSYDWPGNIRELQNAIQRALILSDGGPLEVGRVPDSRRGHQDDVKDETSSLLTRDELPIFL